MENIKSDFRDRAENIADEIMRLTRNKILVNLRFMDAALNRLPAVQEKGAPLHTDGRSVRYDALDVLRAYREEEALVVRNYLHMVFHCVYRHMFVNTLVDRDCWDLACDIAVEAAVTGLGIKSASSRREEKQRRVTGRLETEIGLLSADRIYRYYLDRGLTKEELESIGKDFRADVHDSWYEPPKEDGISSGMSGEGTDEGKSGMSGEGSDEPKPSDSGEDTSLAEDWKRIAERMLQEVENFTRTRGEGTDSMIQSLRELTRQHYDYESFLRRFSVMNEVMHLSGDEFDQIFYTYGLRLYGRMPLIEPLEYREDRRIREFVIAIDTSGSVMGDVVQRFVENTYSILASTESFSSRMNLHIIQCDSEIKEHVKITSRQEFEEYMKTMTLKGFGGTDFRPVFEAVDGMLSSGEFTRLKGLIYFTDGDGIYPARMPEYDTAFVFLEDAVRDREVPPWAIKVILTTDDIKGTERLIR